jgi:hypothetical protein
MPTVPVVIVIVIVVAVAITPAPVIPVAEAIIIAPAVADAEAIIVVSLPVEKTTAHAACDARRRVAVVKEDRPATAPVPAVVIVTLRAHGNERGQREDDQEHRHLKELFHHRVVLLSSTGVNASPAPLYLVEGRD